MFAAPAVSQRPIPGLPRLTLLGRHGGLLRFFREPIGTLLRLHRSFGDVAALSAGDPSLVCAFGPEHNRALLSDPTHFHHFAGSLFRVGPDAALHKLTDSVTSMNGDQHRRHRRMMMPAFSRTALEGYRDDMVAVTVRCVERWRVGDHVDVGQEMIELTLIAAMRSLFGLDLENGAAELGHLGMQILEGLTNIWNMVLPFDFPGTSYARYMRLCERIERRLRALIQERRSMTNRPRDVLSILIEAHDEDGSSLSDDELVGHTNMLFIAGHETTAFTLAWTLFLLSQHPEIHRDLMDELTGELRGAAPTVAQLDRLPLLDAVVRESMRLIPAVPFLFLRQATETFVLGGYELPARAKVILSPLITHRLPQLYPEPSRFNPRRWLGLSRGPYEYLPFGAGPRLCLGAGFAAQFLRVALAVLLQRFRFTLLPGARIDRKTLGITMGPKHGIPMRLDAIDASWDAPVLVRGNIRDLVELAA